MFMMGLIVICVINLFAVIGLYSKLDEILTSIRSLQPAASVSTPPEAVADETPSGEAP